MSNQLAKNNYYGKILPLVIAVLYNNIDNPKLKKKCACKVCILKCNKSTHLNF